MKTARVRPVLLPDPSSGGGSRRDKSRSQLEQPRVLGVAGAHHSGGGRLSIPVGAHQGRGRTDLGGTNRGRDRHRERLRSLPVGSFLQHTSKRKHMTITFADLGVSDDLCAALASRGITEPFSIQTIAARVSPLRTRASRSREAMRSFSTSLVFGLTS